MAIRCKHCKTVIESLWRHDYRPCSCGRVAIDGGLDYTRIVGNFEDYEQTSERMAPEDYLWGTYGNPPKRENYKRVRLGDCTTDHLEAILETQLELDPQYSEAIKTILEKRRGL